MLVTGGAGFIGSNFVRYLLKTDPEVLIINLDALTYAGTLENLAGLPDPDRHVFVQGDICDRKTVDQVMRDHKIDTVVHFAAETHVDRSLLAPELFVRTNVIGTLNLLDAAWKYWMQEKGYREAEVRFHHISTDEVFGSLGPGDPPWTEASPYAPNSPYAASKAASDHLVRAYGHTHGLPYTITNCSNNYGPYQFPEKLIPLVISNALAGELLPIYGDGRQIRDWLYVEDHCEAIRLVVRAGRSRETYNIGGGTQPTNLQIVEFLCQVLDEARPEAKHVPHKSLMQYVADRPGHDRRYAMDSGKIRRELGWRPRHTLEEGLRKTTKWYVEHPEWVKAIREQGDYRSWIKRNYDGRGGRGETQ